MRLPGTTAVTDLDVAIVGVPFDIGTSNRPGARFGPRAIRSESVLIRPYNMATRAAPFDSLRIDDTGDVATNPYNLADSVERITAHYGSLLEQSPLDRGPGTVTLGGDHTIVLPILRALHAVHGPVGLVHVDAHTDINDTMFGEKVAHGTPFRRAVEEGLLDPKRTVQIGIRGALYSNHDKDWGLQQGIRVIEIEECHDLGIDGVIAEARRVVGTGPTYLSFDVDALDPVYAPGTGTPEIGGLTTYEAQRMIRGMRGLNLVGADVVEVSPPFDMSGNTALVAVTVMFEILCLLAENIGRDKAAG